ncbi:MAG: hypothetical protein WC476_01515 [Phycisphaerae bacterium]|jgi:hypothetical protein
MQVFKCGNCYKYKNISEKRQIEEIGYDRIRKHNGYVDYEELLERRSKLCICKSCYNILDGTYEIMEKDWERRIKDLENKTMDFGHGFLSARETLKNLPSEKEVREKFSLNEDVIVTADDIISEINKQTELKKGKE